MKTSSKYLGEGKLEREAAFALSPNMVGFKLLKLTNLLSRPFFKKFAKEYRITLNEWRTIVVLKHNPGVPSKVISHATGLQPMNISRAANSLRKAGLIIGDVDPDNHRQVLLRLTRSGEKIYKEISPHSELQARSLLGVLDDDDINALDSIVDKLIAQAERIAEQD